MRRPLDRTVRSLSPSAAFVALALSACAPRPADGEPAPLVVEATIPLPDVAGRIDHLALDTGRHRLFVAALGNGSVEVVDLAREKVSGRIGGLSEPQGLAMSPALDQVAVATGGDGALRFYSADTLALLEMIKLGDDADNARLDSATGHLVVGYGAGALALIDPATRKVLRTIALPAHPEGFQLSGSQAYVNLPGKGKIAVADLNAGRVIATWPTGGRQMNFPLAVDRTTGDIAVVYRLPSRLVTYDAKTGAERQALPTCGDADDLFFDARRARAYVVCGSGQVDVFARRQGRLAPLARIRTSPGARTGFFSPDPDRLYVAMRAVGGRPAGILVLRPQ